MRARGGVENESKGWGSGMRARDGGVENESEGYRMRARGRVENESEGYGGVGGSENESKG